MRNDKELKFIAQTMQNINMRFIKMIKEDIKLNRIKYINEVQEKIADILWDETNGNCTDIAEISSNLALNILPVV